MVSSESETDPRSPKKPYATRSTRKKNSGSEEERVHRVKAQRIKKTRFNTKKTVLTPEKRKVKKTFWRAGEIILDRIDIEDLTQEDSSDGQATAMSIIHTPPNSNQAGTSNAALNADADQRNATEEIRVLLERLERSEREKQELRQGLTRLQQDAESQRDARQTSRTRGRGRKRSTPISRAGSGRISGHNTKHEPTESTETTTDATTTKTIRTSTIGTNRPASSKSSKIASESQNNDSTAEPE